MDGLSRDTLRVVVGVSGENIPQPPLTPPSRISETVSFSCLLTREDRSDVPETPERRRRGDSVTRGIETSFPSAGDAPTNGVDHTTIAVSEPDMGAFSETNSFEDRSSESFEPDSDGKCPQIPPPGGSAGSGRPTPSPKSRSAAPHSVSRSWRFTALYFLVFLVILVLMGVFVWTSFTWRAWIVVVSVVCIGWAMIMNFPSEIVLTITICLLMSLNVITPNQALVGFSDPTIFAIAMTLVVGRSVELSGILEPAFGWLFSKSKRLWVTQLLILLPAALISSVIPNAPVAAIMIPICCRFAPPLNIPLSKLMMPLSFMIMLGGQLTTIGSACNLFVIGLIKSSGSKVEVTFMDPAYLGLPCLAVGIVYMMLANRLLPNHADSAVGEKSANFALCMEILPECNLVNKSVRTAAMRYLPRIKLMGIARASSGAYVDHPGDHVELRSGDRVFFFGTAAQIKVLLRVPGLRPSYDVVSDMIMDSGNGTMSADFDDADDDNDRRRNFSSRDPATMMQQQQHCPASLDEVVCLSGRFPPIPMIITSPSKLDLESSSDKAGGGDVAVDIVLQQPSPSMRPLTFDEGRMDTNNNDCGFRGDKSGKYSPLGRRFSFIQSLQFGKRNTHGELRILVEAVLSSDSPARGKKLRDCHFHAKYDTHLVGMVRFGENIADLHETAFAPGDLLLLEAPADFLTKHRMTDDFSVAYAVDGGTLFPRNKLKKISSLGALVLMVCLAASETLPLAAAGAGSVVLLLMLRALTIQDARRAATPNFILLLACAFGLSSAIRDTGVGHEWGTNVVSLVKPLGDVGLLTGIFLLTVVLQSVITYSAALAVLFPVCSGIALLPGFEHLEKAVYMVLMTTAAVATLSPVGFPTNLMVAGPGNYKFGDFFKYGIILEILLGVVIVGGSMLMFIPVA